MLTVWMVIAITIDSAHPVLDVHPAYGCSDRTSQILQSDRKTCVKYAKSQKMRQDPKAYTYSVQCGCPGGGLQAVQKGQQTACSGPSGLSLQLERDLGSSHPPLVGKM